MILLYPVRFANGPDVMIASSNSLSVGTQEGLKGFVALELSGDHFGGNTNLQTPASKSRTASLEFSNVREAYVLSEEYNETEFDTIGWSDSHSNKWWVLIQSASIPRHSGCEAVKRGQL